MLKRPRPYLLLIIFLFTSLFAVNAQTFENAGQYMTAINKARETMDAKYIQYLSAAAHGRRARKVENLRTQLLESITQSRYKTIELPYYNGDNSLRQSSIDYILLLYRIFNEDFAKIVNLEEIAEQSFDEMQSYLLLQEKTSEKLREAAASLQKTSTEFAARHKVTIVDKQDALGEKMAMAGKLNTYTDKIYLLFFKCNWQDDRMVQAMNAKKVNEIEQSRNALAQYATEGLKALDTLRVFNGDPTLANACRQVLEFYKKMAEKDIPGLTDFYLKEDNFQKIKKSFDAKSPQSRTQQDVDAFNKAVNEMNSGIGNFNKSNTAINNSRNQVLKAYQEAEKKFADTHMPYYR